MDAAVKPSRNAEVTLDWAGGEYTFRLGIGQLRELQEKCDAGPALIVRRLSDQTWRVDDVRETIRLGLIGGGMVPSEALAMTRRYVEERPLLENVPVARLIVLATLLPVEDDALPKRKAAKAGASQSEASSPSPPSTGTPLRSGSRRTQPIA